MWNEFVHWLKHQLSVHCVECRHNELENRICNNCEMLKSLLEVSNSEKRQLMNLISELNRKPEEVVATDSGEYKEVPTHAPTWRTQRRILEQESRIKARQRNESVAQIIKDGAVSDDILTDPPSMKFEVVKPMTIDQLERELINEETRN